MNARSNDTVNQKIGRPDTMCGLLKLRENVLY